MPTQPAPRRRDLRRRERRRARTFHPGRVLVGTLVVAGVLGAVPIVDPFGGAARLTARSELQDLDARREAQVASRGSERQPAAEDATTASPSTSASATAPPATTPVPAPATTAAPPAAAPPPPPTTSAPPAARADTSATVRLAAEIVTLTNAERRAAGLTELTVADCATAVAVTRTDRLVAEGRFEHDPLDEVVAACGTGFVGENLALGYPTAAAALAGWMGSEGHRANILRPGYRQIGVGCTSGPSGMLCAQVFLG